MSMAGVARCLLGAVQSSERGLNYCSQNICRFALLGKSFASPFVPLWRRYSIHQASHSFRCSPLPNYIPNKAASSYSPCVKISDASYKTSYQAWREFHPESWSMSQCNMNPHITYTPVRQFSSSSVLNYPSGTDNDMPEDQGGARPLKLMEFGERIWPSIFKSIKNFFMMVLIRGYFDAEFTSQNFLAGAEQAIFRVSTLISKGKFDELESMVTREAVREIEQNYRQLDVKQRDFLHIKPADIFLRFIYEIGIILDDATNRRFVEITAVVQGCHGLGEVKEGEGTTMDDLKKNQENLYVCNYRFIREYTKGIDDDWTINKLNHFLPAELAKRYGPFDR